MFYSYPKHKAIDCHIRMTFIQTLMHKLKKKYSIHLRLVNILHLNQDFAQIKTTQQETQKCDSFYI